jgi:hypothetical protein
LAASRTRINKVPARGSSHTRLLQQLQTQFVSVSVFLRRSYKKQAANKKKGTPAGKFVLFITIYSSNINVVFLFVCSFSKNKFVAIRKLAEKIAAEKEAAKNSKKQK